MNKIERDGKIAVLVSPGFGAGWSTWADDKYSEILCMDADIAQAVLDGDKTKALEIAIAKTEDGYFGGLRDLEVQWVPKGSRFKISEYDGSEHIELLDFIEHMTA